MLKSQKLYYAILTLHSECQNAAIAIAIKVVSTIISGVVFACFHIYRDLLIVYTNDNWFVISWVVQISGTELLKRVTLVR